MKKLYCTVVTDFEGIMESPTIYHIKAETVEAAQVYVKEDLMEMGYETEEEILVTLRIRSIEIKETDIIEL
jgi:hypothetical protein